MQVIKEAFQEGRETDVTWNESKAKENAIRMEVFASNVENFNGRLFQSKISLARINPETGAEEELFATRLDAAKWIVKNVLKMKSDPNDRKAVTLIGNMHMSMQCGFRSYGSHWKYLTNEEYVALILKKAHKKNAKPVLVINNNKSKGGKISLVSSIAEAQRLTGVSEKAIRRCLKVNGTGTSNYVFRDYFKGYDRQVFKSMKEAISELGMTEDKIRHHIENVIPVNKTFIRIKNFL
jgi:hypothetical protein